MLIGRLRSLRHRLKSLLRPLRMPILGGPLKGRRWSVFSHLHHLRGTYEPHKTAAVIEAVRPGDVVYDVGAHVGYYTLLAALRTGEAGHVVAFEPRPINLRFLEGHLRANGVENVTVTPAAVGARTGPGAFDASVGTGTGRLSDRGRLPVDVVALDHLVLDAGLPPPDFIKIDVEGAELGVLRGARSVVERARPRLLVAAHGDELLRGVVEWLEARGYVWSSVPCDETGDIEIQAEPVGAHGGR